jgi:hypothetical protein
MQERMARLSSGVAVLKVKYNKIPEITVFFVLDSLTDFFVCRLAEQVRWR